MVGVLLLAAAAGSAAYAAVVSVLAHWPSLLRDRGAGGAARPVLIAAVAVPLAVAGAVLLLVDRMPAQRNAVATALVGVGAAWVAWGLVEQHLLRTFDVAPRAAAAGVWDALFHAVGLVTAGIGASLLSAGRPVPEAT
jgi:hypothetical protein